MSSPKKKNNRATSWKAPSVVIFDALERTLDAKKCIGENRGFEREQAREGYEESLVELGGAIRTGVEKAIENGELEGRHLEALAKSIAGILDKAGA